MKTKKIILIILSILSLVSLLIGTTLCDNDWKSILFGIASSSLVVVVIETVASIKDHYRLANLCKNYKRIRITNTLDSRHPNGIY